MPHRLIEQRLPLAEISEQSAREKSIRHGHISTLHIWWARRPLAACRAAVFATLVPDSDENYELVKKMVPWKAVSWMWRTLSRTPREKFTSRQSLLPPMPKDSMRARSS